MNYTEKEEKGVKKVESMNSFFDKVLLPAIGVIIVIILISFIISSLSEKFGGGNSDSSGTSVQQSVEEPQVFALRRAVLADYEKYTDEFAAYGYEKAEGYSQELALCKVVDEELVIFQFKDSKMGDFTILRYTPSESVGSEYSSLSMTVSSPTLINVTLQSQDSMYTVTFTSVDFSSYAKDDAIQYSKIMKKTSLEELVALYEIFETDINNLAQTCGIS